MNKFTNAKSILSFCHYLNRNLYPSYKSIPSRSFHKSTRISSRFALPEWRFITRLPELIEGPKRPLNSVRETFPYLFETFDKTAQLCTTKVVLPKVVRSFPTTKAPIESKNRVQTLPTEDELMNILHQAHECDKKNLVFEAKRHYKKFLEYYDKVDVHVLHVLMRLSIISIRFNEEDTIDDLENCVRVARQLRDTKVEYWCYMKMAKFAEENNRMLYIKKAIMLAKRMEDNERLKEAEKLLEELQNAKKD